MKVIEASIVLVAKVLNNTPFPLQEIPTLEFLLKKKIINYDESWSVVDERYNAPPYAKQLRFTNGIKISNDIDRYQVIQDMTVRDDTTDLMAVTTKIIDKFQMVPGYDSIGFNFLAIKETNDGDKFMRDFLAPIPQLPHSTLKTGNLTYSCNLDDSLGTFTIAAAIKGIPTQTYAPPTHLMMRANYNLDCEFPKKLQQFIQTFPQKLQDFRLQINQVVG